MKEYKTKKVHKEEKYLAGVYCDICKKKSLRVDNWRNDYYNFVETEVELNEGSRYPDGGHGIKISFDICPECFRNKLIPWMESQNAKTTPEEWDY